MFLNWKQFGKRAAACLNLGFSNENKSKEKLFEKRVPRLTFQRRELQNQL